MNIYKTEKLGEITTNIEFDSSNKTDVEFAREVLGEYYEEETEEDCGCLKCQPTGVFLKGENVEKIETVRDLLKYMQIAKL